MASILVLEDETALREVVVELLEEQGHEVTAGADGKPTSDADLIARTDLLITDIMMPGTDGLEAIRVARSTNPSLRIIAMSGGGRTVTKDYLPVAADFGAAAVLPKPFRPTILLKTVAEVLA